MKNLIVFLFLVGLGNCMFQGKEVTKKPKVIKYQYNMYLGN